MPKSICALFLSLGLLAGCPEDEDVTHTDPPTETTSDDAEYCDGFCTHQLAAFSDSACPNEPEPSYDDCMLDCEQSLTYAPCPDALQVFWDCTMDVYTYECDATTGMLVPPTGCETEQAAVTAC